MTNYRADELSNFLGQDRHYPSESKGLLDITSMDPIHAFNAYRHLRSVFHTRWAQVQHTRLAMALLAQAFDGKIPSNLQRSEPPSRVSMEDVYDALAELDEAQSRKPVHPITRARIVHTHLTKENHHE